MRIALVATGLGMGGAENQVAALADRFAADGHEVMLIAMTGEPLVRPLHAGVQLECLRMERTPQGLLRGYLQARRLLKAFRPDVVHSHMVHANVFARVLRLSLPMRRLICTAHNTNEGGAARMLAYRLTEPLADLTTNVSNEAVQAFLKLGASSPGRIVTMHNGIDAERFRYREEDRRHLRRELEVTDDIRVLLAVGRFSEQKDYGNLLGGFVRLCERRNDCVLWIAGTGEKQAHYESEAARLGIGEHVRFLGLRRDVPALMSAADIFVLSSAWEGLPLVIGEAMACERLVVSTDAGGVREWLGECGYVVPVRDSGMLAAALDAALECSDEERRRRGAAGRERIMAQYALSTVTQRWLQLYAGNVAGLENDSGKNDEQRGLNAVTNTGGQQ
jgi:glycosyltransferase involved in cell wall biosynthesis